MTHRILGFLRHGLARYAADKPGLAILSRRERRRLYRLDRNVDALVKRSNARTRDRGATVAERLAWTQLVAGWSRLPQSRTNERNGADQ